MNVPESVLHDGRTFLRVCPLHSIPIQRGLRVSLDEFTFVAVFRSGNHFFVTESHCPHQHQDSIADGIVERDTVTCPMHGWCFSLSDGSEAESRGRLKTFPCIELNSFLYVDESALQKPRWMDSIV